MVGQGDSSRVEPLEERGSNSAVGFDMCLTLQISSGKNILHSQNFLPPASVFGR
jgi:hypothetical protein